MLMAARFVLILFKKRQITHDDSWLVSMLCKASLLHPANHGVIVATKYQQSKKKFHQTANSNNRLTATLGALSV